MPSGESGFFFKPKKPPKKENLGISPPEFFVEIFPLGQEICFKRKFRGPKNPLFNGALFLGEAPKGVGDSLTSFAAPPNPGQKGKKGGTGE